LATQKSFVIAEPPSVIFFALIRSFDNQ